MAAVAAEPGASAALTTTTGDGAQHEPEIVQPVTVEAKLEAEATEEFSPVMDLVHLPKNGDSAQGCSLAHIESQCKPEPETVGNAFFNFEEAEHIIAGNPGGSEPPTDNESDIGVKMDLGYDTDNLKAELPPSVEASNEFLLCGSAAYHEPTAFSSESAGASQNWESVHHMVMETRLAAPLPSLLVLEEHTAEYAQYSESDVAKETRLECEIQVLKASDEAERTLESGLASDTAPHAESGDEPTGDVVLKCPGTTEHSETATVIENNKLLRSNEEQMINIDFPELPVMANNVPAVSEPEDLLARQKIYDNETELELKPTVTSGEDTGLRPESIAQLIPGSEVQVTLDHIIDDALVVSFRLGEKIFSGVLMDLSKRFGPYGIPVTVFPKREYRDKPKSMQLKTEMEMQTEKGGAQDASDAPPKEPAQTPTAPNPALNQWTSKPPPLFQEGAPYPPPLFIRDTYSQSIPQPLPRKIKRPKRKLYREEPTSIMNAIKLRPRQVLCDKCKGAVVTGDKRELRKGPLSDCRSEEAKRRRNESAAAVTKRPRTEPRAEERGRATDGTRRLAPVVRVAALTQVRSNSAVKAAMAAGSSPANGSAKVQPHTKKVLQSKNVDHSKTGEVLKRRQRHRASAGGNAKISDRAPVTRASCPRDAHQKVHFTRRLHQISGGGRAHSNPLPPRIRIKPQRYRNEENDSSTCKTPGFDKVPGSGSRSPQKLTPPRCTSTRSSSSGEATTAAENQGLAQELEPELIPQTQSHSQSLPNMEPTPLPLADKEQREMGEELDETGGEEKRAGNITVYMSLNPSQPDSSNISLCSVDSTDDLKSSNSECSSTETFDFPPPGALHSPPAPSTSSVVTSSSTSSSSSSSSSSSALKEDKKPSKSLKVFSKNVSKCVTTDGRTICVGDIVWAKIYGFPWWPARILVITVSRKDNGLLVRQEARISWFGSPTTSFLALSQVTPFLENFQLRFDKKRKGLYRKAITEAAKAAKQLTPEVRALLTQFET